MPELTFVDELPPTSRSGATSERGEAMKANPGKWARWPSTTGPSGVRKSLAALGDGFEVTSRKVDGKYATFARFVEPAYEEADEAPPAPVSNGNGHASAAARPKVKCPTCALFVNVEAGEESSGALARHESTNAVCQASNKRNRNVSRR